MYTIIHVSYLHDGTPPLPHKAKYNGIQPKMTKGQITRQAMYISNNTMARSRNVYTSSATAKA